MAIDNFGLEPSEINVCQSHSTSTDAITALTIKSIFFSNIVGYPIQLIEQKSSHALSELIRNKVDLFDFIYVDASHRHNDALVDIVLAWQLLRTGGIMGFDDYMWTPPRDTEVVDTCHTAIDYFLKEFRTKIVVLHIGYRVFVKKIS